MTTREKRIKKAISERVQKEKEDLRNLILDSAAQILLEKGYEKFSLRQVAENIGYSATTIYIYFKDKDELLFAVVLEGFKIFFDMLSEASEKGKDLEERIKNMGIAYIKFAVKNPLYYQVMFMQRGDLIVKEGMNLDNTPIVKSIRLLETLIGEAIRTGLLKNTEEKDYKHYVRIIWSVTHGVASLYIAMPMSYTEDEVMNMARIAVEMCFSGLKA